jgi:PAS domain-containing protein
MFDTITEQRSAEIALMENERFLFNVLQVSPTPEFLLDRNHKVVFWNRALAIMTRLRAEDMTGTNHQWKAFYPDPRPCLADILIDGDTTRLGQLFRKESPVPPSPGDSCESTRFSLPLAPAGNGCAVLRR